LINRKNSAEFAYDGPVRSLYHMFARSVNRLQTLFHLL